MIQIISVIYDDFVLEEISLPPRSELYNLEPIGLGTPYVEGLTSYISRLAEIHSLKVTTLVGKKFAPLVKKHYLKEMLKTGGFGETAKFINDISPVSLEYVSVLEELTTRQDMVYLTMNSWTGIFPNTTVGSTRKWCPACLEEWRVTDNQVYEPLIWYIKYVNICDRHLVELEDKCQNCGEMLPFLSNNLNVGHCQYCGEWLGGRHNRSKSNVSISNYEIFIINNFKTLIEEAQRIKTFPTKNKISFVFKEFIKDKTLRQFAEFLGFNQTTVHQWAHSRSRPKTESTLKICNKFNLSIYDLFCKDNIESINLDISNCVSIKQKGLRVQEIEIELKNSIKNNSCMSLYKLSKVKGFTASTAKEYFPSLCEKITENYLKHYDREQRLRKEKIKKALVNALETEIPVSFSQLTKEAGICISTARRYYPKLVQKVIDRFLIYRSRMKEIRDEHIMQEIREAVFDLHKRGAYPSFKKVKKNLSDPNFLMKGKYKEVWKRELWLLGYNKSR